MTLALARAGEGPGFSPRLIAEHLLTTVDDVARSTGLGRDAVSRKDRIAQPKTQTRLREMVEILNRLAPRFGGELVAFAWYRSQPLPGFAGKSCAALVAEGQAHLVMDYLDAVDAGGIA